MKISDIYKQKKSVISLEVFPPKKESTAETIYAVLDELTGLKPDFISVTYSAGGTGNSNKTLDIASTIKNKYQVESMAHLTCIQSQPEDTQKHLENFQQHNLENILALRGDLPLGHSFSTPYRYATDLIRDIRESNLNFSIGAAAYPEGHVRCEDLETDLRHLKEKQEEGASFFITQLFFDNYLYYKFLDKARNMGIHIPISAGIMPILSKSQIDKMIYMCGVSLPSKIVRILTRYENDSAALKEAGIEYANQQIADLISHGINHLHIYTMNEPSIAKANFQCARGLLS